MTPNRGTRGNSVGVTFLSNFDFGGTELFESNADGVDQTPVRRFMVNSSRVMMISWVRK
jgi:hypothetical protein